MASALGSTSLRVDRGERVADIRDFGAKSRGGGAAAGANRAALQAAHDWLRDAGAATGTAGTIYIPAGDWYIDRPVFLDGSGIGLRGEGRAQSRILGWGNSHDLIVLGIPRAPLGVALTPDHLVDLFVGSDGSGPVLDATAVSGPRQRWGLRTKADAHLMQQGGGICSNNGRGTGASI